jgi:hypothetical protein
MYAKDKDDAQVRPLEDRPKDEVAHELSDDDLHTDAADPPESADAAAAAATNWRVAKCLLKLREQINARFPGRKKASDGTIGDTNHCPGTSDHCPNFASGGVGIVTAMDITHDPAHGLDAGVVAEALRVSRDPRIKYIISNRRIANFQALDGAPAFAWRPYTGSNPHTKHFHVSVRRDDFDSEANWTF